NILLGPFGETLVVDWGLAKSLGTAAGAADPLLPSAARAAGLTVMGSAVGTPAYMSPEQAAGRLDRLSAATDIYGLGATLYCLLTGRPPFPAGDAGAILARVQTGNFPRPRQLEPDLAAPLEAVCLKAMALQPGERYATPT